MKASQLLVAIKLLTTAFLFNPAPANANSEEILSLWWPATYKRVPSLQNALFLTPEQMAEIASLRDNTIRSPELMGLEGEERAAKNAELTAKWRAGLEQILTPEQTEWRAAIDKAASSCETKASEEGLARSTPEHNMRATEIFIEDLKAVLPEKNFEALEIENSAPASGQSGQ